MTYRVSGVAVLVAFGLSAAVGAWFPELPDVPVSPPLLPKRTVALDLCSMWEQIPVIPKVASLIWFVTGAYLIVAGLMNRAAARWAPAMCLLSMFLWAQHSFWRFTRCMSLPQQIAETVFAATFIWMCLQQIFERPRRPLTQTDQPAGRSSMSRGAPTAVSAGRERDSRSEPLCAGNLGQIVVECAQRQMAGGARCSEYQAIGDAGGRAGAVEVQGRFDNGMVLVYELSVDEQESDGAGELRWGRALTEFRTQVLCPRRPSPAVAVGCRAGVYALPLLRISGRRQPACRPG